MARAQTFANRFASLNWPKLLSRYAQLVTPQLQDILKHRQHYWVTAQSEVSTDILFKRRQDLSELYPELLSHGTLCLGAKDVMNFLGRKLRGNFEGEIVSDLSDLAGRIPGCRIKHRVQQNYVAFPTMSCVWAPTDTQALHTSFRTSEAANRPT
jgi:hypothetical protein